VTPLLELVDVSKRYGALRPLRVERLAVAPADRVALVGLDAAAAEVFVNLATGATLPDSGRVSAFGRDTSDITDSADWLALADRFGIVSDRAVLLDRLTVEQNLAMPFTLDIEPPPADVRARAAALAAEVGVAPDLMDRCVEEVDASVRARLRLGRAIALDPAVLLLEHVNAALPADDRAAFGAQVQSVAKRRGIAVVALTADPSFARAVAARVLEWNAASGALVERRGWLGRLLG